MSRVFFTSDWHFCHKAILKYRDFSSIEKHDQLFIDNFNKVVRKNDTVFFLGDIAFCKEGLKKLKELRDCNKKILYLGNHDTLDIKDYNEYFDEIHAIRSYKGYWLTHCPIHPQEMRMRKGNIHGHLHKSVLSDKMYFDVSPEKHNYELVNFEDIKDYFGVRK
jgi:calcineurin-like phosphoesterase family protein